jgi:hypothetical protein
MGRSSRYLVQLGTPARNTRPAGKGKGRSKGYHPAPNAVSGGKKGKKPAKQGSCHRLKAVFGNFFCF